MIEPLEARLPVNWQPLALDDWFVLDEDAPFAIESPGVVANDSDQESSGTDFMVLSAVEQPEHGVLSWELDGVVTYRPEGDFTGDDTFSYTMQDGSGGDDTATVTVTVTPVNDVPIA